MELYTNLNVPLGSNTSVSASRLPVFGTVNSGSSMGDYYYKSVTIKPLADWASVAVTLEWVLSGSNYQGSGKVHVAVRRRDTTYYCSMAPEGRIDSVTDPVGFPNYSSWVLTEDTGGVHIWFRFKGMTDATVTFSPLITGNSDYIVLYHNQSGNMLLGPGVSFLSCPWSDSAVSSQIFGSIPSQSFTAFSEYPVYLSTGILRYTVASGYSTYLPAGHYQVFLQVSGSGDPATIYGGMYDYGSATMLGGLVGASTSSGTESVGYSTFFTPDDVYANLILKTNVKCTVAGTVFAMIQQRPSPYQATTAVS